MKGGKTLSQMKGYNIWPQLTQPLRQPHTPLRSVRRGQPSRAALDAGLVLGKTVPEVAVLNLQEEARDKEGPCPLPTL